MRLLHLDGERLVSTDFRGKTIPPYAILSHRWGDSEVLLEDLGLDACKEKSGYRKIEFGAAQAAQDRLQYFWIDTCCIDKWNLRERSKAGWAMEAAWRGSAGEGFTGFSLQRVQGPHPAPTDRHDAITGGRWERTRCTMPLALLTFVGLAGLLGQFGGFHAWT